MQRPHRQEGRGNELIVDKTVACTTLTLSDIPSFYPHHHFRRGHILPEVHERRLRPKVTG